MQNVCRHKDSNSLIREVISFLVVILCDLINFNYFYVWMY